MTTSRSDTGAQTLKARNTILDCCIELKIDLTDSCEIVMAVWFCGPTWVMNKNIIFITFLLFE